MMGIIKALKCCQNLYQVVVCPCPGAIYMFEIVKKCKISLPAQDELSGEHYRTVGPLVSDCSGSVSALHKKGPGSRGWGCNRAKACCPYSRLDFCTMRGGLIWKCLNQIKSLFGLKIHTNVGLSPKHEQQLDKQFNISN